MLYLQLKIHKSENYMQSTKKGRQPVSVSEMRMMKTLTAKKQMLTMCQALL